MAELNSWRLIKAARGLIGDLAARLSHARSRGIVVTSVAGVAQRSVQLVASLIALPIVLRSLGVNGFGIWAAATSLSWAGGMLDLGLGSALIALVSGSLATKRIDQARDYIAAALVGGAVLALFSILLGSIAIYLFGAHAPSAPFIIACIALAVNIPLGIAASIWLSLQKGHVARLWEFLQTVFTLAAIVVAASVSADVMAFVALAYGIMLAANSASLIHLLILNPTLRPGSLPKLPVFSQVFVHGRMIFGITAAGISMSLFDNAMALAWCGPAAAAQMAVALRICTTASGMLVAVAVAFWPAFAEAAAVHDKRWMLRTLRDGTITVGALAAAGSLLVVAFGAPILRWWLHEDLRFDPVLLWSIAAWIVILSAPQVAVSFLMSVHRLKEQFFVTVVVAILALVLKYFAAKLFGVVGILGVSTALFLIIIWPTYAFLTRVTFASMPDHSRA